VHLRGELQVVSQMLVRVEGEEIHSPASEIILIIRVKSNT
jgi:hypothetical protein